MSSMRFMSGTAPCTVFSHELIDSRPGQIVFEASGKNAGRLFAAEPGGHRWQRVPPTEKRGRRHTSTVTVAVLPLLPKDEAPEINERDIEWQATVGTGNGGQKRNKTANCVQMKHLPSGIAVRVEAGRSLHQNRETALRMITARLHEQERIRARSARASARKGQVGSGMRGDKVRTIRMQDHQVVDHRTGKKTSTGRYLKGHVADLV
jgi:peptide chain release factor 1